MDGDRSRWQGIAVVVTVCYMIFCLCPCVSALPVSHRFAWAPAPALATGLPLAASLQVKWTVSLQKALALIDP